MSTNPESAAVEAVAWRYWSATHPSHVNVLGPGQYEYMDAGKWHPDHAEPLYPQSALDALRGEVERLRAIESAARTYYREYCQDEAGDDPDDNGRGMWTGASAKQISDAAALRDALTKESP